MKENKVGGFIKTHKSGIIKGTLIVGGLVVGVGLLLLLTRKQPAVAEVITDLVTDGVENLETISEIAQL